MGVITGLFGTLSTLATLLGYEKACIADLPDTVNGYAVDWSHGVGYNLVLVATLFKLVDLACHALVPVPQTPMEKSFDAIEDTEMERVSSNRSGERAAPDVGGTPQTP